MPRRPLLTHVESAERVTPRLVRVTVAGPDLEGFGVGAYTDHYVKLQLPPRGASYAAPFDPEDVKARLPREEWPVTRTYTVRAFDPAARTLTIDFVVHGDEGTAGPWAAAAQPGDPLQLMGPGGAYAPDPEADWHLLVGDESVLPAIAASLARVPAGRRAVVVAEVDPGEELELHSPGELEVTWRHRDPAQPDGLVAAVEALAFPDGAVHAFVHGEAGAVRSVRRHLVVERGVPVAGLSASGYWKQRRTEDGWRDDKAEWKRLADADLEAAAR